MSRSPRTSRRSYEQASTTASDEPSSEGERLQKVLARAGFGSRRACEILISSGRVLVDGAVPVLGQRVDLATTRITVDGVPVVADTSIVHWLLNKPPDHVTTANDPQGRRTVLDLVPSTPRVFPVGRLDRDTEGLLILTNDGELAQLLTHPSHGVEKEYLAEVEGVPAPSAIRRLREGVELDDGMTRPAAVRVVQVGNDKTSALVEIVVKEGRKRMVRRMCRAVGHPVVRLVRTRIGSLADRRLAPGSWRELTPAEVRGLYAAALGELSELDGLDGLSAEESTD
jgi:23S rRNA pseudouridine2605 synthase